METYQTAFRNPIKYPKFEGWFLSRLKGLPTIKSKFMLFVNTYGYYTVYTPIGLLKCIHRTN